MQLTLKWRSGATIDVIDMPEHATVEDFQDYFYKNYAYYPERQRWTVETSRGPVLSSGPLADYVKHNDVLVFKDLGIQISWRLVFVCEYFGPLLIFPLLFYFPKLIYTSDVYPQKTIEQTLGFYLVMFHFLKRELETLFIHRFSHATMPISRLPINCTHYWLFCGLSIGYYLFHPQYVAPWSSNPSNVMVVQIAAFLMLVFEFCNLRTHIILRNLRPRGTKERQIPYGCGFGLVSCANYLHEVLAWVFFSIAVGCLTSWIFTAISCGQTMIWAAKKHAAYKKEFPNYPSDRKAMIPFIF